MKTIARLGSSLMSCWPYALILVLGAGIALAVHTKYTKDISTAEVHYQHEMFGQATSVSNDFDRVFRSLYQGLRTIALLPSVRKIDRYATNFNPDARQTTQEIYNNLASNVAMSEVYIVPLNLDPDRLDKRTGKPQIPITTFDQLIVGRHADQGRVKKEEEEDKSSVEEIEIYEYRLMKRQLAWLRQHYARDNQFRGLEYPVVCGPEVITCDNTRFSPSHPDDKDRSGLVYSVPFYDLHGELKGCISGIILTHALRDLLPSDGYVLLNQSENYIAPPHSRGLWQTAMRWIKRGFADPELVYSNVLRLKVRDLQGQWRLWSGQPNSIFWKRSDVLDAQSFALVGYLGSGLLVFSLGTLTALARRHRHVIERKNQELEGRVRERTTELEAANLRLQGLATTDPLTGLPNHRALVAALDQEIERSNRFERSCALLFFDLDHFKAVNDVYGHAAGDTALRELSSVIVRSLRGMDTVGRWGGEEFVVILPETDDKEAQLVAERMRSAVAAYSFPIGGGVHMTCSAGIAVYPTDALHRIDLVSAADQAMYAAKRLGRNQVRRADDPAVSLTNMEQEASRDEVALQGVVQALARLVEARDNYTGSHTEDVAHISIEISLRLGLTPSEARMVGLVGQLHDVGKVAIPDAILQKPGPLTAEEWAIMKRHPVIGADVCERVPGLRGIAPSIRAHHERWDGTGYPDGLAGEAIPLSARIIAAADAYSAMTTDRPYHKAHDTVWAISELRRNAGTQFDPKIVEILITVVREVIWPNAAAA